MLLWWAWTAYAWLANVVSVEQPALKLAMLVGMSAMFVLALCIPEAFDDGGGGLDGPLVLALATCRPGHAPPACSGSSPARTTACAAAAAVRPDRGRQQRRADRRLAVPTAAPRPRCGRSRWSSTTLGTWLGGASGWRLPSPGHFSERHGLIVIIALGESIVAIGVGVAQLPITWPILVASALGLVLASAMWWAYFDVSALVGEEALASEPVETRARPGAQRVLVRPPAAGRRRSWSPHSA